MPDPGELRHRVDVKQLITTQDSVGQPIETYVSTGSFMAKYESVSGDEKFRVAAPEAVEVAHFTIRKSLSVASIDPTYVLQFRGKEWNIINISYEGNHLEWLKVTAKAGA